jgi:rhodanese-related sulfurtransferase
MKQVDAYSLRQIITSGQIMAVFDLRPPPTVQRESIPGAKVLSLEDLQNNHFPNLPKETSIYLICERGAISELAGLYLEAAGFTEVYNLAGGMIAWREEQERKRGR